MLPTVPEEMRQDFSKEQLLASMAAAFEAFTELQRSGKIRISGIPDPSMVDVDAP